MNLLWKLPSVGLAPEPSEEVDEAQAKRDRIKFHRDHVRNGPVKFRKTTDGQIRRAQKRALKRSTQRARKAQVRGYFATQKLAASTRGQLQAAGLIPYVTSRQINPLAATKATVWLVQRFGTEDTSFAYGDVVQALQRALKFYGQFAGLEGLEIPEGYTIAVYEEGTKP